MPFQNIEVRAPRDLNVDISPYEIPAENWTYALNAGYDSSGSYRVKGASLLYTGLPIDPIFTMAWNDGSASCWLYANQQEVRKHSPNGSDIQMSSGFGANFQTGWHGFVFNGVAVLNNGINDPQYANTVSSLTPLTGWPSSTQAQVLRPFKNYLMAMDITSSGSRFPSRVLWSDSADVGSVPPNWSVADPASRSGQNDLADTPGSIVDGLALGDSFIVYKTDSVWALNLVGGTFVFNFRKIFDDDVGALTEGCVAPFEGQHFVLTRNDAYIHNGVSKRSIMNDRVRGLLTGIDDDNYRRTKVIADTANKEIIVYYPATDDPDGLAQAAITWNWEVDSWGVRYLKDVSYIAQGIIGTTVSSSSTPWDDAATDGTWDTDFDPWDFQGRETGTPQLVVADPTWGRLLKLNVGNKWNNTLYSTVLEKTGVDFETQSEMKRVRAVYPSIKASYGTVINIEVGYENSRQLGTVWEGPYPFVVGEDRKVDVRVNGRNLGIRFSSTSNDDFIINGYEIELMPTGARR